MKPARIGLLAYGALGLPLAFAALPIYVHVPHLYAGELGLPLAAVGAVLVATRIVDAVTDPLIGWAGDRWPRRRLWIIAALPLLLLGLPALLAPPAGAGLGWMAGAAVVVSLGYSLASIAHQAWGAEAGQTPHQRTALIASREGFALAGVITAASLPTVIEAAGHPPGSGLAVLAWVFVPLLIAAAAFTLTRAPSPPRRSTGAGHWSSAWEPLRVPATRRLLCVFAVNGIGAAVTASTVLFYIDDVLAAGPLTGAFLATYFLAAAASLPLWTAAADRQPKPRLWAASMLASVAAFAWAAALGPGDTLAYALICLLTGAALGADLALPPALLADQLAGRRYAVAGVGFGWWNFLTKANLSLAAGLALPLLAVLGYAPGERSPEGLRALAAVYAGLPVALKLVALTLLLRWRHGFTATLESHR